MTPIELRNLTGRFPDIQEIREGLYTRPVGDGFLVWTEDQAFRVRITEERVIQLLDESWDCHHCVQSRLHSDSLESEDLEEGVRHIANTADQNLCYPEKNEDGDLSFIWVTTQLHCLIIDALHRIHGIFPEEDGTFHRLDPEISGSTVRI